jgi:hypothetical protein
MCYLINCPDRGTWRPVLALRTRKDASPVRLAFAHLTACDAHKQEATVDSFLSPEGFDKISRVLRDAGKPVPMRKLTTLQWEKIHTIPSPVPPEPAVVAATEEMDEESHPAQISRDATT